MLNRRQVLILLTAALACGLSVSCSSSGSKTATTQNTGLQLTPSTNQTLELNTAGLASLPISANQSVTWTLASGNGLTNTPTGATLSCPGAPAGASCVGSQATFNFSSGTPPSCGANASPNAPQTVEVIATAQGTSGSGTSSGTSATSAVMTVNVVGGPPCLTTLSNSGVNQHFAACPASGTVLTLGQAPATNYAVLQAGTNANTAIFAGQSGGTFFGMPPFTWSQTGTLPTGTQLQTNTNSGVAPTTSLLLVGTPTTPGCTNFQLQLTDALGGVSCDPNVTTGCSPTTFYVAVIPSPLNISVAPYPYSYDGIPYPPVALQVAGSNGPYTWSVAPGAEQLATGLTLTAIQQGSNIAEISGTPAIGDSQGNGGTGINPQPPISVSDSQTPYPAVGQFTPNMWDYLPTSPCSPSSMPLPLTPVAGTGGVTNDGNVWANNYLRGQYGFMLRGFDGGQPTVIAGSMTFDGGSMSDGTGSVAGIMDVIKGGQTYTGVTTTGTYIVGLAQPPNLGNSVSQYFNRGCVTLNSTAGLMTFDFSLGGCSNGYSSENGLVETYDVACGMTQNSSNQNIAAGVFTTGRMIVSDDGSGKSAMMSGILRMQNATAFSSGLSGPYAFGLAGWDSSNGHYAMAGSMHASSSSLSSVAADIDDAGTLASQLTGGSGTLSSADTNGRITGTLSVGSASFDVALYEISANEAFVVTTDALSASHPLVSGEALTTASSFSATSLSNNNILAMGGVAGQGPDVSVGLLTFDGISAVGGTIYEDQAATLSSTPVSAVYQVDGTTGRATFTAPQQGQSVGNHGFVAYLIPPSPSLSHLQCSVPATCVTGFVVGTDGTAQDGIFEFQAQMLAPPFTNRYIEGDYVYGTIENLDASSATFEGDVFATPSASNNTGGTLGATSNEIYAPFTQDSVYCFQSSCPQFVSQDVFHGSYSLNSNGSGVGSFGGGPIVSITNGNVNISIDESPTNAHPSITIAEQ